jgi:hypothetical protein
MRPTMKMYNDAVNAADNWRRNFDAEVKEVILWHGKYYDSQKSKPFLFLAGLLTGVLGILIISGAL